MTQCYDKSICYHFTANYLDFMCHKLNQKTPISCTTHWFNAWALFCLEDIKWLTRTIYGLKKHHSFNKWRKLCLLNICIIHNHRMTFSERPDVILRKTRDFPSQMRLQMAIVSGSWDSRMIFSANQNWWVLVNRTWENSLNWINCISREFHGC